MSLDTVIGDLSSGSVLGTLDGCAALGIRGDELGGRAPPDDAPGQISGGSSRDDASSSRRQGSTSGSDNTPSSNMASSNETNGAGDGDGHEPPLVPGQNPGDADHEMTLGETVSMVINLAMANSYGLPTTIDAASNWVSTNTGHSTVKYPAKRAGVRSLQALLKTAKAKYGAAAVVAAMIAALNLGTTKTSAGNGDDDDDSEDDDLPDMSRGGGGFRQPPPRDPPPNPTREGWYYEAWDRAIDDRNRRRGRR